MSAIARTTTSVTATTAETRLGATRLSRSMRNRIRWRICWPISTRTNKTRMDIAAVCGCAQKLSLGTPMRSRTRSCQKWNHTIIRAVPMIPTTMRIHHAMRGALGLESCDRMYRTNHTASTPSAYPMAPEPPLTSAWNSGPRGSNEGVMDSQRKTRPTAVPVKVYCRAHQCLFSGFCTAVSTAGSSSISLSISLSIAIATPFSMPPAANVNGACTSPYRTEVSPDRRHVAAALPRRHHHRKLLRANL